jgi:hypothetical protein
MSSVLHIVHFWLKPEVGEDRRRAMAQALRGLGESPNVGRVRVGRPAGTPREVVDNSYDLQLLIEFADQAAADAYQAPEDKRHTDFINEFHDDWARVLIYDSLEA